MRVCGWSTVWSHCMHRNIACLGEAVRSGYQIKSSVKWDECLSVSVASTYCCVSILWHNLVCHSLWTLTWTLIVTNCSITMGHMTGKFIIWKVWLSTLAWDVVPYSGPWISLLLQRCSCFRERLMRGSNECIAEVFCTWVSWHVSTSGSSCTPCRATEQLHSL